MPEESFPLGAIPERLKCTICTALARDAWKLACCDQIICGACYETLPEEACPICAFSPLEKEKCTASTSLRTTIAVFLRHAEKRYKDALAKEAKDNEGRSAPHAQHSQQQLQEDQSNEQSETWGQAKDQDLLSGTTSAQNMAAHQSPVSDISRQQTPSMNSVALQQQQREYEKIYGNGSAAPNGLGMGYNPIMNGFPMSAMNPMMMQQMALTGGFGGYGGNGMNWNPNMMQGYPQNMNMQVQESTFSDHAPPAGPSMPDFSNRGGYRGRYAPRGHMSSFSGGRGGSQSQPIPVAPVFVEGAPTGPSAMRNGTDSRGRGVRGRGGIYRGAVLRPGPAQDDLSRSDSHIEVDQVSVRAPEQTRGRSRTRSRTRERSLSLSRQQPLPDRDQPRERSVSRSRQRSRTSMSRDYKKDSRKSHHTHEGGKDRSSRRERPSETYENDSATDPLTKSLADRIEKIPRSQSASRSRSPRADKHKSRRSSHRSRRRHSTSRDRDSRARSRSNERRPRSKRDHSADRDGSRRHKKHHNVFEEAESSEKKSSRRRRSRERTRTSHKRSSRRSDAKSEIGSPELRRLEDERENARYN